VAESLLPSFTATDQPAATGVLLRLHHAVDGELPLACLAGPAFDLWASPRPVLAGEMAGVRWTHDGHCGAFTLRLPHAEWCADPAAATARAYRALEAARQAVGLPHWWRIWNYLGGITQGEGDAERYRQFTRGRHQAWGLDAAPRPLPAATAIGCEAGLHVIALAGTQPAETIENPRQLSAWRYPRAYGEKPPSFTRASLVRQGDAGLLFVSGTASIVGHESLHAGDATAQWEEARRNLAAVVAAAAEHAQVAMARLQPLNFKLYWSQAADAARLTDALRQLPDRTRAVLWLYHAEGHTHEEIAALLGQSVSFSKSQLARGTRKLRALLQLTEASHA